ncbi:MAG: hypothetical protein MK052_00070 [Alphaproteobacteria bacterium]|nr:hypothetical protein [Alphaproteobacteria bacterium]
MRKTRNGLALFIAALLCIFTPSIANANTQPVPATPPSASSSSNGTKIDANVKSFLDKINTAKIKAGNSGTNFASSHNDNCDPFWGNCIWDPFYGSCNWDWWRGAYLCAYPMPGYDCSYSWGEGKYICRDGGGGGWW